jgi:RNA polymerase sigma-B factor
MPEAMRTSMYDTHPISRAQRCRRTAELVRAAHDCDDPHRRKELLDEVVLLNRGVAEAIASRYRGRGVSSEDLEQAAFEGLVKAVHRFDPSVRPDLLTYAVPTIRGEVQRHFRDHSWTIRPPRAIQELQWKIRRSSEHLSGELGREPTTAELASDLDCTIDAVDRATQAFGSFRLASLDQTTRDHEDETRLDSLVVDTDDYSAADTRVTLARMLRDLSGRDRRIIHLHFFEEKSQTEIGEELGITQTQVSRLLQRILSRLRDQPDDACVERSTVRR